MPDSDFRRPRDPVTVRLWIAAGVLLVGGGLAVWYAMASLEQQSDAQLYTLLGGMGAFLVGMFLPVGIEYRRVHGGGAHVLEGRAGFDAHLEDTSGTAALTAEDVRRLEETLRVPVPFLESEIRTSIRYTWILGWTMTILFGGGGAVIAMIWGFGGPEWLDGPVGAGLWLAATAGLGLGGASSNVRDRRRELATIRGNDSALSLAIDDVGIRVGLALLLGKQRKELASRRRPFLPIQWRDVERWEVLPATGGGTHNRATPPRYRVYRRREGPAAIERTALAGHEGDILERVRHFMDGELVLRDDPLD